MILQLLDFIMPRACRICGHRLDVNEEEICTVCNWQLPRTHFCKTPFDNPMARLFWGRFPIEKAAGWSFYQPGNNLSTIIYDLKYHGAQQLAENLGQMVAREFSEENFFDDIDLIVPVPLTIMREIKRGYNQSTSICKGISKVTGLPIEKFALRRLRFNESQTRLSYENRVENVENSFRLLRSSKIKGKHILLVDDIVTTGATVSACAKELCKAGDVRISILSLGVVK